MESLASQAGQGGKLAESLTRIINDPTLIDSLHDVLGPFCHESRNILNSLKMSLYLAQRDEGRPATKDWKDVDQYCLEIEQLYDRLQMICRPLQLACVRMSLTLLLEDRREAWLEQFASRGRSLELIAPGRPDVGDYDPNILGRALDAFVMWRADAGEAGQSARLRWSTRGGYFHLEWIEAKAESRGVEAAGSMPAPRRDDPLALPLLGRIVSAHGGAMKVLKPTARHVRLAWPQTACRLQ